MEMHDRVRFTSCRETFFERFIRRFLECVLAFIALIFLSPLFIACYIAVKSEDGGSVFFKQERIGLYGKPFYIFKFRSMYLDAEENGPELFKGDKKDKRLTKVGRFLRSHHLDELPQLWNVLIGDMAIVGPRPERQYYIDKIIEHNPRYIELYQVRPGLTSYATLYNGYTDTMDKMLRRLDLDLDYLEHRSLWNDLKIVAQTVKRMIIGE